MAGDVKYITRYQKANTTQVNVRLSKKYDADIIGFFEEMEDTGKATYIKKLIREDMARRAAEKADGASAEEAGGEAGGEPSGEAGTEPAPEKILTVAELAVRIGSSVPTVSSWYRFKKENPEHELAKLLPDFFRKGAHRTRCWHESDIEKLLKFKASIPQGRNGVMGSITQKYQKRKSAGSGAQETAGSHETDHAA
ncbi:hypothetical protein [Butyrivibrio sp. AE2032]|uniref:hypothetical protein n=1 Tax=Butyrivibrio sp. AE2032 TaxID=1458463 RepID=UPI0005536B32|nr:hypothetical protein [Butyrivibrio sp. AE2032]